MFAVKLFFAGLWPLIWDYSWPLTIILIIFLIEIFSTTIGIYVPFLAPVLDKIRKDLLWVAVTIAIALLWGAKVGYDAKLRCDAKAAVVVEEVSKEVGKAKTDTVKKDRFITND
jgi:hypothetical protein